MAKAFMPWVGGKQRLLPRLIPFLPARLKRGELRRYAEPFLGAGSMFLHVASHGYGVREFFLLDANEKLMWLYAAIRDDCGGVIDELYRMELEFVPLSVEDQSRYYYERRDEFNEMECGGSGFDPAKFAALFLFLKRTGYGGLQRENSSGKFNVSFANKKHRRLLFREKLIAASRCLREADLFVGTFQECASFVNHETFVYLDPPYVPISDTSNFAGYTKRGFGPRDHDDVRDLCFHVDSVGGDVMLSNSDFEGADDYYSPLNVVRIPVTRTIGMYQTDNPRVKEIVVTNYGDSI